jgi:hypothetical protein
MKKQSGQKKLKNLIFLAQKHNSARWPAWRVKNKAAKAWADYCRAHVGRMWSKVMPTINFHRTVTRGLQRIKTLPCRSLLMNPSLFRLSRPKHMWERWGRVVVLRWPGWSSGNTVVGLLAGGRRSPEGECAAVEPVRCNTLSRPRDLSRDGELRLAAAVGDDSESFPEDTDGGSGVMGPRRLRHRQVAGPTEPLLGTDCGRKLVRRLR